MSSTNPGHHFTIARAWESAPLTVERGLNPVVRVYWDGTFVAWSPTLEDAVEYIDYGTNER